MQLVLNPTDVTQRLERAVETVSEAWFPANTTRIRQIQTGLRSGLYLDKLDDLINEIRADFALFTYCLRELLLLAREDGEIPPLVTNPIELLRWGGLERLRPILLVEPRHISHHTLTEASALQAARFLEAMTSASAAELLAESHGVDSGLAYTAALMRQLGLTLIAWNYPDSYERAVDSVRTVGRIDVAITQALGFPPNLLALTLAKRWGLPDELCTIISQPTVPPAPDGNKKASRSAANKTVFLCMIGEALARANDPDHYPSAPDDWDFARAEIRESLGPDGIGQIAQHLSTEYLVGIPTNSSEPPSLDAERRMATFAQDEMKRLNPYVLDCPLRLRQELEGIYRALVRRRSVKTNLQRFIKEVLPAFPWAGGWIYTIDPHRSRLVARTRFGTIKSDLSPGLDYLPYSSDADIINLALRAQHPMIDQGRVGNTEFIIALAGAVGSDEPIGVLFLEAPIEVEEKMRAEGRDLLKIFQAIVKGLTDCLELSRVE